MKGVFTALSFENINNSSILKLDDARVKRFSQLREKIVDYCHSPGLAQRSLPSQHQKDIRVEI